MPPLVERQLTAAQDDIDRFQLKGLDHALTWLQENRHIVQEEQLSVLHNDFHPLNIMSDGQSMSVLDWSDAAVGDRHHDLARTLALFELAPPLARGWFERSILGVLRRYIIPQYLSFYRAELQVDEGRLRYWQALHAFKAWVQLLSLEVNAEELGARQGAASDIPPGLLPAVRDYFHERAHPVPKG
jgi:aminoglycoside phosphotransferase (APT) family kinase protein